MSRHALAALIAASLGAATPAFAAAPASGSPPESIDILVDPVPRQAVEDEECATQREAAVITNEIVVCGEREESLRHRLYNDADNETRYARETMNRDNPPAPDVAGEYIFRGPATVSGLCFIGPCPKPPAYIVDVTGLPDAPPGSDADRIAHGLPPIGEEGATLAVTQPAADELGLPESRYAEADAPMEEDAGG